MKTLLVCIGLIFSISIFSQNIKDIENLISSERFDDAYNLLQVIKSADPQNPYIPFLSGEITLKSYLNDPYSDTKNNVLKRAESFFKGGVKIDSLNPLNYVGLGIVQLFKNGDTLKADTYLNKAFQMLPPRSSGLFSSYKKKYSELHINTLIKLETAELYSRNPRYKKCNFYNNILMDLRPGLPEAYINFGDVMLSQNKASEAIALYKKALYIEKNALTNVMVGKIYFMARNYDEAKTYFEAALHIDSLFAPAYKGLGDVYYKIKKNKLAQMNYSKFLNLTGNNIPAKINYVKALFKANDFDGTISIANDILQVDSSKYFIYRLVGYAYTDKDNPDYEKALHFLRKFMSKAGDEDIITKDYQYYSKILLNLKRDSNDIRQGVEMLEKAYLMDTTDNEILVELIKTSYINKIYDIEIKYLKKKISLGDNTPGNYMLLGKAYYYNKEFNQADSTFGIITQADTTNIEAYLWKAYSLTALDPELKEGLAKPAYEKLIKVTDSEVQKYKKERFDAFSYMGSYYMFSKEIDYTNAIRYLKNSIEVDAENTQWQLKGFQSLGYAYYKSKQWASAKQAYETVLKLKQEDSIAPKMIREINKYLVEQELSN